MKTASDTVLATGSATRATDGAPHPQVEWGFELCCSVMRAKSLLGLTCLLAALSILIGAFGAHALKPLLSEQATQWYQTATQYLMFQTTGALVLSGHAMRLAQLTRPIVLILLGVLIFSGSLYIMAMSGIRWLGAITPIGGLLMIIGWVGAAYQFWKTQ